MPADNPTVAIIIPCLPRDLPYLQRAIISATRQVGPDNLVLTRVTNEPLSVALNTLIRGTTADLIVRLDTDDELCDDAVLRLRREILRSRALIVYARKYLVVQGNETFSEYMDMANPLGCSNIFWRWAWERVGGYDEELKHQEAWDFYRRVQEVGQVAYTDEVVYFYHKRDGSMSSDKVGIAEAREQIAQKMEGQHANRELGQ